MYANGLGVLQDNKEAFRLFQLAAAQNDTKAKCALASMYAAGLGTTKDVAKARELTQEGYEAGVDICRTVWEKNNLGKQ